MEIPVTGKLDFEFFNYYEDRAKDNSIGWENYHRLPNTWNVYFHGFMDELDDIAYVRVPVELEPGIYETTSYGIHCYLFYWKERDVGSKYKRGLLVKHDDQEWLEDALTKYQEQVNNL